MDGLNREIESDEAVRARLAAIIESSDDVIVSKTLEGIVTNVTAFGAFVDIGVHQDGLVHVSQLSDRFVKDPNTVVRVGDSLKVRVLAVDLARKRISLSASGAKAEADRGELRKYREENARREKASAPSVSAFGASLLEALKNPKSKQKRA